jgi:hypothetical protein
VLGAARQRQRHAADAVRDLDRRLGGRRHE